MLRFSFILAASFLLALCHSAETNNWPIIGVFTQPSTHTEAACGGDCLYLAASYVKYLEAAGARVVPINYYADTEELDNLFDSLNGVFFVGGGSAFPKSAQYLYDKTVTANNNGDFAPLWGTCMGFQWLLLAASQNTLKLDPSDGTQMNAENYSIPLDFTNGFESSRLFSSAPPHIIDILANQNVTMNNHHYGIWTQHFEESEPLTSQFKMLSSNKDRNGGEFVSTIEAHKMPIYGSQWHPEKNIFEWQVYPNTEIPEEAINHSFNSIQIAQYTANFYVQEARKSKHKFACAVTEYNSLIFNYQTTRTEGSFVQTYFFRNDFKSFNDGGAPLAATHQTLHKQNCVASGQECLICTGCPSCCSGTCTLNGICL